MLTRKRAFSVLEFMVASFLTLLVFTFAALGIESTRQALTINHSRDINTALSYSALDQARVYGCGALTGDPSKKLDEQKAWASCRSLFSGSVAASAVAANPINKFSDAAPSGQNGVGAYNFSLESSWATASGAKCPAPSRPAEVRPTLVTYDLKSNWVVRNQEKSSELVSSDPAPVGIRGSDRGIIMRTTGSNGIAATITAQVRNSAGTVLSSGLPITRTTTGNCLWFAGLTAGTTHVAVATASGSSVETVALKAGQVINYDANGKGLTP